MVIMLSESGAGEEKARAAAEAIPISDHLATKQDIARLETRIAAVEGKVWKAGIAIAGFAVLFNRFLDWAIPGK